MFSKCFLDFEKMQPVFAEVTPIVLSERDRLLCASVTFSQIFSGSLNLVYKRRLSAYTYNEIEVPRQKLFNSSKD